MALAARVARARAAKPWGLVACSGVALLAALAACGGDKGGAPRTSGAAAVEVRPLQEVAARSALAREREWTARSHLIGTIERKALGPFTARDADGGLVAWIVAAERGGGQQLVVVPTGRDGAPLREPKVLTTVSQEAMQLFVRPAGGSHAGWLVAWSALLDRGESLTVTGLAPDTTTRTAPTDLQRTSDHFQWMDLIAGPHGVICLWAEETQSGDANILAAPVDSDGRPHGMPVRIARGVIGWAAIRIEDGVGLALVTPARDSKNDAGNLSWVRLDTEGRPVGAAVTIGTRPTVTGDVDVVTTQGGWLLAWTDRTGEDAQVTLAMVDPSGKVRGPRRAMDAVGGTSLVALASGPAGVALAWQEPRGREREMRPLHMASVVTQGDLMAQPVTAIEVASKTPPELVATPDGFALLASMRGCADAGVASDCEPTVVPTFVRFDARLDATQTEPLYLGTPRTAAALGWALRCASNRCIALAATGEAPTPVYTVDLQPRVSSFAAPMLAAAPHDAPRVTGVLTVASGQPYIEVSTAPLGEATLIATLTSPVEAPLHAEGAQHGRGGLVVVRPLDPQGRSLGAPSLLTSRALPVGGVAIAAGGQPEDGALVAWVARDDGDPQVHLAHVDRKGKRTNEVQLTTTKGDASDVAIAWAGDGWMVAWVDTRDGNGEVYATKVDRDLSRTAREERITSAPGDAGDVSLAVHGDTAWLAWSDPRESPREGLADIYTTTLRTRDARRESDEVRVLATAAHSRSPTILATGDGAMVAWIEDGPTGLEAPAAAMVVRLDAQGHVASRPAWLPMAGHGRTTALALAPAGDGVRAIVARNDRDDVTLDAVAIAADGTPGRPWALLDLDAPGSFDVALALTGGALFFDDIGPSAADHRIRRAAFSWSR
jgi:hypothetical protein